MRTRRRARQTAAVLAAIERGVRYSYDISRETRVNSGPVHAILRELEREGHIEGRWEAPASRGLMRRRAYEIKNRPSD